MARQRIAVGLFFLSLLLIGVFIFKDYGINWDEPDHAARGQGFLDYILRGDRGVIDHEHLRSYGALPEIILAVIQRAVKQDFRTIFLLRHLILFLIFCLGVWFFYLLGQKMSGRWEIALLGCLMLVLSPRIFAHSFHNAKDIPLMSAVIVAAYTLVRFLEKQSPARMAWHALACAAATDVRLMGMLTFFLTGAAFLLLLWEARKSRKKALGVAGLSLEFIILYVILTILFWPTLWEDPVNRLVSAFHYASKFPWPGIQLYLGTYYTCGETPWHYVPVWIAISTPLLYLGFFIIGVFSLVIGSPWKRKPSSRVVEKAWGPLLVLFWFFVPLLGSMLMRVCTYNEFRHLFFIYPALILISLGGLKAAFESVRKIEKKKLSAAGSILLAAITIAGLGRVAFFMAKNHPHENVYFNRLAGRDMARIARKFEMDYWGLSYKQALEYVLRVDSSEVIRVVVQNRPGEYNAWFLPPDQRRRLEVFRAPYILIDLDRKILRFAEQHPSKFFINPRFQLLFVLSRMTAEEKDELLRLCLNPQDKEDVNWVYEDSQRFEPPKYFLTNYSLFPGEFPLEEVHSIKVGNASILGICRLNEKP
ncbi:MAG: glycosyltransferase family 39 protein [Clostridiales bacterium]|nr:glycosyltransferase family 39 protein [Clostridiales bacterium]